MKKTFYQTNIFWQLLCFAILAIVVVMVYGGVRIIIQDINQGFSIDEDIVGKIIVRILYFLGVALFFKEFIRIESINIHLDHEKIFMKDDGLPKKERVQYYAEVRFVDIESVDIIRTEKNSKGKKIDSKLISGSVIKPYLSIKSKSGGTANFFIMYMAKKDVIKLIDEIKKRMRNVGNMADVIEASSIMEKLKGPYMIKIDE